MASRRSPMSAEIEGIAAEAEQQALMPWKLMKPASKSGRSGLLSILPYLDDLHEMKSANWAAAIHEYLISGVKAFVTAAPSSKTIFLTGCVSALGAFTNFHILSYSKENRHDKVAAVNVRVAVLGVEGREKEGAKGGGGREEEKGGGEEEEGGGGAGEEEGGEGGGEEEEEQKRKKEKEEEAERKKKEEEDQRKKKEEEDQRKKKEEAEKKKKELEEEQRKREDEEEEQRKRKEEEDQRKKEEEANKKKKELEEEQRKREEEQRKRKEEEDQRKKEEEEEAEKKKKDLEEEQSKKKEEEEADSTRKEEEEEEIKRKRRQISPSSLSRRVLAGTRIRRQPELYTPEDFRYHKATKVNVSTSEPIYVDSQESTDTLPRGKKEERRDYVAREVLGVAKKSLIERFLNVCIINDDLMFNGTLEGYENFLYFNDIQELLFARESESVIIDCYVNTCLDDKSKHQHFDHAFTKLDRAPIEFDLLFSPMHVEELKRYLKGKHIDAEKWPLRYPDPCPQQGSGDDCSIFTCKYMECLACRDIQDLPFSQDDMPNVRAKFALHFIKVYFNAQERS
ncbi:hypothetical protein Taro_025500 [Colocasia esculenta]|uniref:Ubiquitin-like protease family profile domain-containing protein n=1 Tax=Colocasia esculenta TaxID=4460 RepID=A0A843VHR9_COLES|nr:hypothetical protein [Colocasia esculenta]